jgi:hypothetical protein
MENSINARISKVFNEEPYKYFFIKTEQHHTNVCKPIFKISMEKSTNDQTTKFLNFLLKTPQMFK